MAVRKDDEIMAECLLKGGKMLEKTCKTCGCPLFEIKGKKLCVVCEERGAVPASAAATAPHEHSHSCRCSDEHESHHNHGETCNCDKDLDDPCDGGLVDELAMTIFSLCERIQNEKDPENVLLLMNAVKTGTETLELLVKI